MRFTIVFLCLFVFHKNICAQTAKQLLSQKDIVGVWQKGSPLISSALDKCFKFYKDSTFILNYSEYDDLGRIQSVQGIYRISDSTIYLTILMRTEIVGGSLIPGSMGFQSEEFVLYGGKSVTVKQPGEKPEPYPLKVCSSHSNTKCIQIQNTKYYKLSSDPNKYNE